jgi:hypothetical protein
MNFVSSLFCLTKHTLKIVAEGGLASLVAILYVFLLILVSTARS